MRPNNYFSPKFYSRQYDVEISRSLYHFLTHGWRVHNNPNNKIDIHVFLRERRLSDFSTELALDCLLEVRLKREIAAKLPALTAEFKRRPERQGAAPDRSITIVTVNLNNAAGLQRTFESIASQTDICDELVVVDGGSHDGSLDVIRANRDLVNLELIGEDKGIFDGMNLGVQNAKSEYVVFMNSGDTLCSDKCIEIVRPRLGYADIVYGATRFRGSDNVHGYKQKISLGMAYCHQSQYTRRCWLERFPFELGYRTADWRLGVRAYLGGATFALIDEVLSELEASGFSLEEDEENFLERWCFARSSFPYKYIDVAFESELLRRF